MTSPLRIPQADPGAGYRARKPAIDAAVTAALDSGWYILGKEVSNFEAEFAAFIGVGHGIGVANGTDALALALRALGIGNGDAVATVSHTAVATVAAVEMVGATPVLVDIEDEFFTMDPQAFEQAVLDRQAAAPIRAVIPVHLYGQAAAMDKILAIARRHDIRVVEDCAQAHGATFEERRLGSLGDVAAYSLYPTKNLGALGDGGIVTTADPGLAADLSALRQYGWRDRYVSDMVGVNSRLDEVQAALLRVRLRHLAEDNRRRQLVAAIYDQTLAGCGALRLPARRQGASHVFHQYVVRTSDRDGLQQRLRLAGIGSNVHYPVPVHLQPAYKGRIATGPGGLPNSEAAARTVLSLPMFPQLTDEQAGEVGAAVRHAAEQIG